MSIPIRSNLRRAVAIGGFGLLVLTAPVGAEEGPGEATAPEPFLQASLPDLDRSRARFAESPYATLSETPWAIFGIDMAEAKADEERPGTAAALSQLSSASFAMDLDMMAPSFAAWLRGEDLQPLFDLIVAEGDFQPDATAPATFTDDEGTTLSKDEDGIVIRQGVAPLQQPELPEDEGDLNLLIDYAKIAELAGASGEMDQATVDMLKDLQIRMELSLDPIGLRERIVMDQPLEGPWAQFSKITAKRELLESLPADTLWGVTSSMDRSVMEEWLATEQAQEMMAGPGVAQMDMMLQGWGLPDYATILAALGGDNLVYVRTSAPFPALTLSIGIEETVGTQLLETLATQAGWMDLGDGSYQGLLGFSPIFGGYLDGNLVITSHPGGLPAHTDREPGFFQNEQVQAALTELPEDTSLQVIGLSRTGDWWGSLADLAAPFAGQSGVPGIALLGQDLRQAGKYGFLWSSMDEQGRTEMESGGLFGGLMTNSMALGGGAGALFAVRMRREMGGPMPPPQGNFDDFEGEFEDEGEGEFEEDAFEEDAFEEDAAPAEEDAFEEDNALEADALEDAP